MVVMPRGKLSTEVYLRQSNTRLKKSVARLREDKKVLRDRVKLLECKVAELEAMFKDKEAQRKALLEKLYKPRRENKEKKPLGKKQGSKGYHRPKPKDEDVTEEIRFTPTHCPYCKRRDGLSDVKETIVKYTEDIVICPEKIIKKYLISKHWCGNCKEYIRSDKIPPHIQRIGENVMAYILYARYKLRLPYNKIQQSLKDLHSFKISEGEIALQLERAKELFNGDFEAVTQLVKIADKVYCDETGWRIGGKSFWIWVFVTDKGIKYVIEDTRGKGVAECALGEKEDRVLISDFYAAYKNIPGKNQYCWVHLLRDSKTTESTLHDDLKQIYQEIKKELAKERGKRNKKRLDKLLEDVIEKTYEGTHPMIERLQKRIKKTRAQLLTCLDYDNVLPENNTAERALRNHVVMRKIFGGSRSLDGAKAMEVNTTVIDTLLQQNPGKSFFEVVLPRLRDLRGE